MPAASLLKNTRLPARRVPHAPRQGAQFQPVIVRVIGEIHLRLAVQAQIRPRAGQPIGGAGWRHSHADVRRAQALEQLAHQPRCRQAWHGIPPPRADGSGKASKAARRRRQPSVRRARRDLQCRPPDARRAARADRQKRGFLFRACQQVFVGGRARHLEHVAEIRADLVAPFESRLRPAKYAVEGRVRPSTALKRPA